MSLQRVLVGVDDSPAGLAAARLAVELAASSHGRVRAVAIIRDGVLASALWATSGQGVEPPETRLAGAARALLTWVSRMADSCGVACEPRVLEGEPYRCLLEEARAWAADVIVVGRSDRRGPSSPYVGSETERLLEFAELPVLVVPSDG